MYRFLVFLVFFAPAFTALATDNSCNVSGTAFDTAGNRLNSVVRLVDRHTRTERFSATDAKAGFAFDDLAPDASGQRYRIDVLSAPTVVTGSRIPVRSIVGIAPDFACAAGQTVRRDVRAQVD